MQNAWNVQYEQDGRTVVRVFKGDSPKESGAVPFARSLRKEGISAEIISRSHAFPPPLKQILSPRPGLLWCPYCIKWREFEELVVVREDYETPALPRCTVCLISIKDYYIRRYNPELIMKMDIEAEMKKTRKKKVQETSSKTGRRRR